VITITNIDWVQVLTVVFWIGLMVLVMGAGYKQHKKENKKND